MKVLEHLSVYVDQLRSEKDIAKLDDDSHLNAMMINSKYNQLSVEKKTLDQCVFTYGIDYYQGVEFDEDDFDSLGLFKEPQNVEDLLYIKMQGELLSIICHAKK